jgi:hypothetical protein
MATGMLQQRSDCRVAPFVREACAGPGVPPCPATPHPLEFHHRPRCQHITA